MQTVAVVTNGTTGDEALYLDGILKMNDSTIYACDIAQWGGRDPICFRHFAVDLPDGMAWPGILDLALEYKHQP